MFRLLAFDTRCGTLLRQCSDCTRKTIRLNMHRNGHRAILQRPQTSGYCPAAHLVAYDRSSTNPYARTRRLLPHPGTRPRWLWHQSAIKDLLLRVRRARADDSWDPRAQHSIRRRHIACAQSFTLSDLRARIERDNSILAIPGEGVARVVHD